MAVISDMRELTPEKALIFRVTHIDNVPWILDKGLHCSTSKVQDPHFVAIGNPDLIQKRTTKRVPVGPRGTLDDYVPFYFTPCSPMLYSSLTGYGVTRQTPEKLALLVVSLRSLAAHDVPFVFSDRHAYMAVAKFWTTLDALDSLGWHYWQQKDFKRDPNDPSKFERYQAEALIHRHVPAERIEAIVCSGDPVRAQVAEMVHNGIGQIEVVCRKDWFFRGVHP